MVFECGVAPPATTGRERCMLDFRRTSLLVESLEDRSLPSAITVTSVADTVVRDGAVTLREAILAADTHRAVGDAPFLSPGPVVIKFSIPGNALHTIRLRSPLPA